MVKLYKRTLGLVQKVANMDVKTCPDQDAMEEMITEAREILKAIEAV